MKLITAVEQYVLLKRSLGAKFRTQAVSLMTFCRLVGPIDIDAVQADSVRTFLAPSGIVTTSYHQKLSTLRGLYRFAINRCYVRSSPLPLIVPKQPAYAKPYIYSPEELRRLLTAAHALEGRPYDLPPMAFRALILLLYGAGLRISDLLSLCVDDVNLQQGLLLIRNAKFDKPRIVPIGLALASALDFYIEQRPLLSDPAPATTALFVTRLGQALTRQAAERDFRIVRARANIHRQDGAYLQPRLHDLRHTFAVHRLLAWYRSGSDVQVLLPKLATYLGHVGIAETQHYLSMTPELLDEANRRFERYALPEVSHE